MKTLREILAAAALLFTSLGAQAAIEYTKLSGAGFDVYHSSLANYSATVQGTTLSIRPLDIDVSAMGGLDGDSENGALFVVAHGGKTVKSAFAQRVIGAFQFDGVEDGNNDVVSYALTSLIVKSNIATHAFNDQDRYAFQDDLYHVGSPGYATNDVFDSAAIPTDGRFVQQRFGENFGSHYNEFALLFHAQIYAQAEGSGLVSGSLGELVFTLETSDAGADIPEPGSLALFALGSLAFAYRRRSRR